MADNPSIRGAQDRARINMSQDHEVRYWSEKFGCTREELQKVVDDVGPMAADVERRFKGRGGQGA